MQSATQHKRRRGARPQSDTGNTRSVTNSIPASQKTAASSTVGDQQPAPWRALFFFTTKSNTPLLIAGIIISVTAGAASPAQAFVLGKLYNEFTSYATRAIDETQLMHNETKYVVYLTAVAAASWLFHSLEFAVWLAFGELQAKSARDRLFYGLLEREIEWYDMRKNGIGALLPRLQAQIRELQLATAQPLGSLFYLAACAILNLIQAFVHSWNLTLVTLASAPLIMGVLVWVGKGVQGNIGKQQEKLAEAQKYSTGAFSAIETVKCFNGQELEADKYSYSIQNAAKWYTWVANSNALQMGLIIMLSTSMFVQGFYYGGVLISQGKLNSGDVITTFFSAIGAFQSIQAIFPQMIVLEKGRSAGSTLRAIMAKVQSGSVVKRQTVSIKPARCDGDIDVKNVSFAYPSRPDQLALNNVSLYIPGGEMTFLIGKSGSGKSTLGQLLLRFYPYREGSITVDNVALASLDTGWLRSNITLVEQQSLLFNDTVARNIAFGRTDHENVSQAEVLAAAEFALLQVMIHDMPNGLDTIVGYKGGSMSGGQRQRMALARARLRDTPILLLDESTSALDHISRTLMMEAIRHWRQGKTTIIITHDISQILPDDYAFILEHGKLVQEGFRRHMEKLKGTPFQAFLTDEQRAAISPLDIRKDTAFESIRTRGSSLDSFAHIGRLDTGDLDPLEVDLHAGESKRVSFMPRVFAEGTPLPAMRAYGQQGPTSTFASPWLRMMGSPTSESLGTSKRHSRLMQTKSTENTPTASTPENKRWSHALEKLIDRTGHFAAESRSRVVRAPRRLVDPENADSIPLQDVGNIAEASRTEDFDDDTTMSFKQIMMTLWPNLSSSFQALLVIGIWGATTHAVASPLFAFVLSKLLATYAVPGGDKKRALQYAMAILAIAITDAVHTYLYSILFECIGQRWVDNIRTKALRRILDQPRAFFEQEENGVSHLTESLDRNAEEMRNLLGRFAALIYIAALMVVVTVVWALAVQWKLTLVAFAVAPYIYGVTKAFSSISEKWEKLSTDAAEAASAIFTETFTNIKTVRALTLEAHFLSKYVKATNAALKIGFQRSLHAGLFYGLSDSAGNFSTAMIFYVGAKLVVAGTPVPNVVQVFTMLIFTLTKISAILAFIPQIESSKDTASRLLRLAYLPKDSHEHLGDTRVEAVGDIVFDDLRFAYPSRPDQTILRGINLCLQPGTCTAIVGGSGSGKSTIANLLLDLYSTATMPGARQTASLTFGGRDVQHIDTRSLRRLIVPVAQTPTLFAATVSENIAYGLESLSPYNTPQAIAAAAKQAGIHDFIVSLPLGYETFLGDGGAGLSGGQAQRIAIARALVRRPAVLILDEATSALDPASAALVRDTIYRLVYDEENGRDGMSVIIITHHRDMMEIAKHVVVLEQGQIVEEGTFEGLLEKKGGALVNLLSGGEWNPDVKEEKEKVRGVPILKVVDWKKTRRGRKGLDC